MYAIQSALSSTFRGLCWGAVDTPNCLAPNCHRNSILSWNYEFNLHLAQLINLNASPSHMLLRQLQYSLMGNQPYHSFFSPLILTIFFFLNRLLSTKKIVWGNFFYQIICLTQQSVSYFQLFLLPQRGLMEASVGIVPSLASKIVPLMSLPLFRRLQQK